MTFTGKETLLWAAELVDAAIANLLQSGKDDSTEEPVVSAFLFHRFFVEHELRGNLAFPHERMTVSLFECLLRLLRRQGFDFVLPSDIAAGNLPGNRLAMLTVDDGYADNLRILDIVTRYGAKIALFVSAAHICNYERFWPDALWIGAESRGWSKGKMKKYLRRLSAMSYDEAAVVLRREFGADALRPSGFIDRPMNTQELAVVARSPHVEIGCHAFHHTILSPRPATFVRDQLNRSIEYLLEVAGRRPIAIAYPNGVYSQNLIRLCQELGFTIGLTIEARNNRGSDLTTPEGRMRLGRFTISGRRNLKRQLQATQVPVSVMRALYKLRSHRTPPSLATSGWT